MHQGFCEVAYIASSLAERAERCGIAACEVEWIIGIPKGSFPRRLPSLDSMREACLRRLDQLCILVLNLMPDDATEWFRTPSLALGGSTPLELMLADAQAVAGLLYALRSET